MYPKINRQRAERIIYVVVVIFLVLYGIFRDSAVAETLIRAVKDAFSILIQ